MIVSLVIGNNEEIDMKCCSCHTTKPLENLMYLLLAQLLVVSIHSNDVQTRLTFNVLSIVEAWEHQYIIFTIESRNILFPFEMQTNYMKVQFNSAFHFNFHIKVIQMKF